VVVVNGGSRRGRACFDAAVRGLRQRGIAVIASELVEDAAKLQDALQRAIAHDPGFVVIGGGDGTISEIVDLFAHRPLVLGLLPLGTSNNFARTHEIPTDIDGALDVLAAGKVVDVDLGRVGDDLFANVASIGLTVAVASKVSPLGKRYLGRGAYAITGLRALAAHQPFTARVVADGRAWELALHQIVVANGRFHAGRPIAAAASADDRCLTVYAIRAAGPWRLARNLAAYLVGRHHRSPDTLMFDAPTISIETAPVLPIEIDGELNAHTPATIPLAAEALYVMAPQGFLDA